MSSYTDLPTIVAYEIKQKSEEGFDTEEYEKRLDEIIGSSLEKIREFSDVQEAVRSPELEDLYQEVKSLKPDSKYVEPFKIRQIFEESPSETASITYSSANIYDKIYGAWAGRCAGCLLGRPVEGWGGNEGKKKIARMLKSIGEYPLTNYFSPVENEEFNLNPNEALRGNISTMIRDDDIDYTILNLKLIENHGLDFQSSDVAELWLNHLPFKKTYTAERVAYRNLVEKTIPPESGIKRNPYREWIGAQIRADLFGWINPGEPKKAAEIAYRDGIISHRKNGIYGEMFISALLAGAFDQSFLGSLRELVKVGLSVIPKGSRLAKAINNTLKWSKNSNRWEETYEKITDNYGAYHWVHTIPNAALVVQALLHGNGDFEKSISIAVMSGYDTDCTGATVGSILGLLHGKENLPQKWIAPLHGKVKSSVYGETKNKISDLASRVKTIITEFE